MHLQNQSKLLNNVFFTFIFSDDIDIDSEDDHPQAPTTSSPNYNNNHHLVTTADHVAIAQQKSPDSSTSAVQNTDVTTPTSADVTTTPIKENGASITKRSDTEQSNKYNNHNTPAGFRPGRLNHMEILERLFPYQKKPVLELVLQGCNGDLVKAIEHFLSAQDTIIAQQQLALRQHYHQHSPNSEHIVQHPGVNVNPFLMYGGAIRAQHIPQLDSKDNILPPMGKSAFTALNPITGNPHLQNSIHSAFPPKTHQMLSSPSSRNNSKDLSHRTSSMTTDSNMELEHQQHKLTTAALHNMAAATHPYHHFFHNYSAHMGALGPSASQLLMHPFRPWALPTTQDIGVLQATSVLSDSSHSSKD